MLVLDFAALELVGREFIDHVPVLFVRSELFEEFEATGLAMKREFAPMYPGFDFQLSEFLVFFYPSNLSWHEWIEVPRGQRLNWKSKVG